MGSNYNDYIHSEQQTWIFVLWYYNFSTGTAVLGDLMDFRSLVVQL